MCSSPILIDNLNYGNKDPTIRYLKDTVSSKIPIPCGHCPSCLALKQNYFVQRFECESLDNDLWTGMLSYSNAALPRVEINGYKHSYASSRDVQLLIKRLRNYNVFQGPFRYWFISERGSAKHRPHWHFMISTPKIKGESISGILTREKQYHKIILDNWYTNYGSKRSPIKVPNLIYCERNGRRNYDFHWLNPNLTLFGCDDVAFYNSKYLLKDDDYTRRVKSALYYNLPPDTFKYYWSLLRHKSLSSHFLGDIHNPVVIDYINFCIKFSYDNNLPFPCFINPNTGQTFPLAPYFRRRFVTVQTALAFRDKHSQLYYDDSGCRLSVDVDVQKVKNQYTKFQHVLKIINARDIHADFNFDKIETNSFLDYGDFEENLQLPYFTSDDWQSDFDY